MKKAIKSAMLVFIGFSLALLCGNAAANSERISFNLSNIALFGTEYVKSGDDFVAKNGQEVPVSVFYTDEAGGYTNYLSVGKLAEILDADIKWDGRTNTVDFGTADTPQVKTVNPPFTELGADSHFTGTGEVRYLLKEATFQSESAFQQTFDCHPRFGQYILIKVTNHGEKAVSVTVLRAKTIGDHETFPTDIVYPGETLSRIFSVSEEGNELTSKLSFAVKPLAGPDYAKLDITADVIQQDGDGSHLIPRDMASPITYDYNGLTMEPKNITGSGMELILKNQSKQNFYFGEDYYIEHYVNNQWVEVDLLTPDSAILLIAHDIRESGESTWDVTWLLQYGELPEGKYRIIKGISEIGSQQDCCYLAADFEV